MNKIIHGDCLEKLKELEENSVDSIVTDPPYELGFMGKSWDNTGIANNKDMWAECLRVLKPGGHLLAFSGTRTYHRMASAIEDAGFEVRDMIEWVYGSGFPKSLNIGKAVDKSKPKNQNDISIAIKESGLSISQIAKACDVSPQLVKFWVDNERTIQPQEIDKLNQLLELELEYTEDLREEVGINKKAMSGWNMDGTTNFKDRPILKGTSENAKHWNGWGTALKPAHEPICMARKPLSEKTVAENVLKYGTGGINIDESRVGTEERTFNSKGIRSGAGNYVGDKDFIGQGDITVNGRFPANLIHDNSEEVRECFPEQKSGAKKANQEMYNHDDKEFVATLGASVNEYQASSGNTSRFFKSIIYQAKSSKSERTNGGTITNQHPTIKPIALMEYLIKMVTKPGGIVLDPFAGSGSTLVAAKQNGFQYIGIEMTEEYIPIINARLCL